MSGRRDELFELSADLLCTCDFDGHVLDLNRAWEAVLGYTPEQMRSMVLRDLIHPEDFEEMVAQTQSLQLGVQSIEPVIRMVAADGKVQWIRWKAVPSADRARFHAIGREVTRERVMYDIARSIPGMRSGAAVAEHMLSEARVLLPGSWTSVALLGEPEAEVVAWEVSAASGGPRHRLLMSAADYGDEAALAEGRVVHLDHLEPSDELPRFVARHIEEGMRASLKVPILLGDAVLGCLHFGSEVAGQYTSRHIEDAREVASQLGVALQQIRLHRALEASEADFRSIAANADGMVIVTLDRRVKWANRAADELFGLSDGLEGSLFEYEMSPGQRSEIQLEGLDSRDRRTLDMAVVRTEWEGKPARLASLRDVTEQRRLEANLRQAQKMAVVGRLAGGVAHDFNNLLTAMMGHVELLRHQLGPGHPADESALAITDAVDRATRVAQQVLAFSRKQVIDPKPMDLHRQIRRIEPLLRQATGEDVELHVRLGRAVPNIVADPIQIEQIAMNLVVNARDAIEGRGTIELTTVVRAVQGNEVYVPPGVGAGSWVVLGVRDSGFGMGSATLEQIFEPFFTTKAEGSGLGLGLSTVHDIVRKSGGHLQVQTAPGQGTHFSIWFPPSDEPAAVVGESSTVIETLAMGQEVVLVVDDEPALRNLLGGCLSDAGYDVHVAHDGLDALQRADGLGHLDLLLTDVRMPGMNGRELDGELRLRLGGFQTIYMSGYSEDILSPEGVLDAGVEFIAKPFRLSTLLKRVRQVLDV